MTFSKLSFVKMSWTPSVAKEKEYVSTISGKTQIFVGKNVEKIVLLWYKYVNMLKKNYKK